MNWKTFFSTLADQIRRLTGRSDKIKIDEMLDALSGVELGENIKGLTAASSDVVSGKLFVGANGEQEIGTMVNHGAVDVTLDSVNKEYTVTSGYHNGKGKVRAVTQTKTVIPSSVEQWVYPDDGKFLSAVLVGASAPGVQYYTGTFQNGSISNGMTIDTGVALSEEDIFLVTSISTYVATQNAIAIGAVRMAQDDVSTFGVGVATGMGGISGLQTYTGGSVTYSGSEVRVLFGGSCVTQTEFRWILIKR